MTIWEDPIKFLNDWLAGILNAVVDFLNLPAGTTNFILNLIGVIIVATFGLLLVIFLTWLERKVAARFQDRFGPNRAGPYGIFQSFADMIKLITKEDITPTGADKISYNIAPLLSVASVILIWAVVPFTATWVGADINVGVLYIAAVGSFGILSVLMAGWSSNNKYALLGAFRAVAQLISYEVPLFLALLIPVLLARSMGINTIVEAQGTWFVVLAPLPFLIFLTSSIAEIGRTPFDLLEAESEIVAGFHIEYTGMKYGMFMAGEFLHAFTISVLTGILFFGGWQGPMVDTYPLLGVVYLMTKAFIVYFIVMWVRSTLPRVRIDHLMAFNWKFLVPLSLVMLIVTALLDKAFEAHSLHTWILLGANVVVALITVQILRVTGRRKEKELETFPKRPVAVPPKEEAPA
ncbi:MAG: NADH-quinone oxidoreductase subunit NuoH [Anaerolineae bacterium]|nr:NADH-quinone oxidoreductase subunit NuoH [Anaerolineae bacterium]